jgi:hypothetical protein
MAVYTCLLRICGLVADVVFLLVSRSLPSNRFALYFAPFLPALLLWDYRHCGYSWPIVPASGDNEDDCGEHDGMKIGRGIWSSRRKPAPAPLLSITKSHVPTRVWTRAAAVGSRRLTAWAMARPSFQLTAISYFQKAVLVTSVIGLAFLSHGSLLMEITLQLLPP